MAPRRSTCRTWVALVAGPCRSMMPATSYWCASVHCTRRTPPRSTARSRPPRTATRPPGPGCARGQRAPGPGRGWPPGPAGAGRARRPACDRRAPRCRGWVSIRGPGDRVEHRARVATQVPVHQRVAPGLEVHPLVFGGEPTLDVVELEHGHDVAQVLLRAGHLVGPVRLGPLLALRPVEAVARPVVLVLERVRSATGAPTPSRCATAPRRPPRPAATGGRPYRLPPGTASARPRPPVRPRYGAVGERATWNRLRMCWRRASRTIRN